MLNDITLNLKKKKLNIYWLHYLKYEDVLLFCDFLKHCKFINGLLLFIILGGLGLLAGQKKHFEKSTFVIIIDSS